MTIVRDAERENQILQAALDYARRSWPVLPLYAVVDGTCTCRKGKACDTPGKHPRIKDWTEAATADLEQIRHWWEKWPLANLGILTGPRSGLFMFGPDGQEGIEAVAELERQHGPLPPTPRQRSGGGGRHYVFCWPSDGGDIVTGANYNGKPIDVRGSGGQFVAAPSRNKNGAYLWEVSPDEAAVAPAPQWLLDWIRNGKATNRKTPKLKPKPAEAVPAAGPPTSASGKTILTVKADTTPTVEARAIAYLEKCPPAVSGQGGHSQTLSAARGVVYGFDLGAERGFDLLWQHFNPRCIPPWTESELRHKAEEADTVPFDKPRGYLLTEQAGQMFGGGAGAAPAAAGQQTAEDDDIEAMAMPEPPPWPTLEDEALHGLAGQIVQAVEPETEAGTAAILGQLLAMFGNAVGRKPHFTVGPARHRAKLNVVVVGDTSSAKGMAYDIAADVVGRAAAAWAATCIHRGLGSGEGIVEALRDPVTKTKAVKNKSSGKVEFRNVVIEEGAKDKRLLAVETEFAAVLKKARREGSVLSEIIRSAWDDGVLEVLNRKENALRTGDTHVSLIGHITPCELLVTIKGMPELVNGFFNRFLPILTRSSRSLPHGGDASVLDPFIEPMRKAIITAGTIGLVKRTTEADRLWESVYEDLKHSRPGSYGKARERARPQTMRLALVYALLDGSEFIEVQHLQAALAVWSYCDASARLIFGTEPEDPLAELVLAKIKDAGPAGMTRNQIRDAFNRNISAKNLVEALAKLRDRGMIYREPDTDTGGRPAERWRLRGNAETRKVQTATAAERGLTALSRYRVEETGERVVRI